MARKQEECQLYTVSVEDWDFSYHFSLEMQKHRPGPYWEHSSVTIHGKIVEPVIKDKLDAALWIMGDTDLDNHHGQEHRDHAPLAVGPINTRGEMLTGLFSIPLRALAQLVPVLASGKVWEIQMNGTRLKWRKALIHSFGVSTTVEDDDA